MFRKILSVIFAMFMFLPTAHGAEMVNVEYIHQYLNTRWGIDLPYNPELKNPKVAANMKYLLTVVDIANEFLNNEQTTDYGNGEYATLAAADTVATNTAIDTLINAPTFTITTTPNTSSFSMIIGAAGNFIIDWGDGEFETIKDKPIGTTTYSHKYTASGEYEIKLTGRATDYSDAKIDMDTGAGLVPAFALTDMISGSFMATNVAKISGGLGRVFPTMDDGSNPNFYGAFAFVPITEIPADLFDGIHGAPAELMFASTFMGTQITEVPAYIFGELNGDGAPSMFEQTFRNCVNLTTIDGPLFSGTITPAQNMFESMFEESGITSIPANLFGTLNGDGAMGMFSETFRKCANLTTIEGPLFSGTITPAESMFNYTFYNTALTEIPANLFGTLNGDGAPSMFDWTFVNCKNLTTVDGPLFSGTITPAESMFRSTFFATAITEIPADLFAGIRGAPAESMFYGTFSSSAITSIPADLFAGIQGAPAESMFSGTFAYTAITSIPADLFAGIQGAPAKSMFSGTFRNCANLQSIPSDLFAGISGAPAERMFDSTFNKCANLQSIPENLFAGISGPVAEYMFWLTFADCTSLTGPSARINGQYLYEIWPGIGALGYDTYENATGLSDYDQIPYIWK